MGLSDWFSFGKDNNDGSYRQDKYSPDSSNSSKHDHTWSKTDPTTGQHKEGHTGANAPRSGRGNTPPKPAKDTPVRYTPDSRPKK
jgi:hypothetical protein